MSHEQRWSCPFPSCGTTVTIYASQDDIRAALDAVQTRHAREHRKAALVVARMEARTARRRAG